MMIPVLALALGCTREMENRVSYIDGEITLYATSGEGKTRTVLQQDGSVYWSPGDCINVFYGSLSGKFTSNNTAPADYAEFTGLLGSFVLDGETEFVAAYPYDEGTTQSGQTLNILLPAEQTAMEGTFADDLFICAAKSKDYNLFFYNVCGGVKFSLARGDIRKVVFRGNGGEPLAGRLSVGFDSEGLPQVDGITDGNDSVTLVAPDGGTFKAEAFYYLVLAPQILEHGYTMEMYADGLVGTVSSDSSVSVRRSAWGVLKELSPVESVVVPDMVDLGLPSGLKWASFNLGATKPEEYGDYYAWGETEPYYISLDPLTWKPGKEAGYAWESYKWCMGTFYTLTKYNTNSSYGYDGFTDGKTVLDPEDDAAYVNLGGKWRMPTKEEQDELRDNCTWEWTQMNGVDGYKVKGPSGNSIFIPASGLWENTSFRTSFYEPELSGFHWSSNVSGGDSGDTFYSYLLQIYPGGMGSFLSGRYYGYSIRPVYDDGPTTTIETLVPTNIGPCSVEIPFTISTNEVVNDFGIIYSTDVNEPVVGNYGDGSYSAYFSSEGSSMIISDLKPNMTYYARAFITLNEENGVKVYGNTIQFTTKELSYKAAYVDLGLSVAWATSNLGSSTPSNVGGYYGWGETVPASLRTGGYKWSGSGGFTKYNATDGKVTLDASDDAVYANLGGKWRMPTNDELTELRNNCTWTPAIRDGVKGCTVTGPNGNSIFIPVSKGATGFFSAEFLSSSMVTYYEGYQYVHALSYSYEESIVRFLSTFRDWGTPIRPVYDDSKPDPEINEPEPIDLGLSVKWATFNLGASKPEGYGYSYSWGETQPKEQYTLDNYLWYSKSDRVYTKYNWRSDYGVVDNKLFLDVEDDAAVVNLGGEWRMPTSDEMMELMYHCDWTYFENYQDSGISGCVVRGKKEGYTDNFIFIPSGVYQSSTLQFSEWYIQGPYAQQGMEIGSSVYENYHNYMVLSTLYRSSGWMIRPVSGPRSSYSINPLDVEFGEVPIGTTVQEPVLITNTGESPIEMSVSINAPFSLDVSSISLNKGESMIIKVSFTPDQAVDYQGYSSASVMGKPFYSWINVYGTGK